MAPHDKVLGVLIANCLGEIEKFFRKSIEAAQADGTVPPSRLSKDLARLLLGVLLGIRVLARANPDRALLEGVARPAFALLDFEPASSRAGQTASKSSRRRVTKPAV